ncbi:STAS domain-containing protein [Streptomyces sp. NPDC046557]|uniref:STAS domain-containing protein n=1 Tax=Streptomyces sp. NPDC046557 TaxID=3155372 RepID=UPI0033E9B0D3
MTDDPQLNLQYTRGPLAVLSLTGDVDLHTAPALRPRVLELIEQGQHHLVMDMSQVEFCDSAGLSALIGIWHAAQAASGSMSLVAIPDRLQRMLSMTGLDTVLTTHATAADALVAYRLPEDAV